MQPRRPQALDAGLFLVVVAVPLVFTPFTSAPFADPKLLLLTVGTALIWLGAPPADRGLALAAGVWFAVTGLTAATGVDPLRSLTGLENALTGLGMFACCAVLVVAGAGLDRPRIERVGSWLVWTGLAVALATLAWRLFPDPVEGLTGDLPLRGGTLGNPVFAGALIACAIAAALVVDMTGARRMATLIVLVSGISVGGERVAWLLPLIALVVTLWWARAARRRAGALGAVVLLVLTVWAIVEPALPEGQAVSPLGQVTSFETDTGRFTAFAVHTRAFLDRPLTGWGPGTTLSAYRATATPEEIDEAGFTWNEAHNLVIQTASQSGVPGLAALAVLVVVVGRRVIRAPRWASWVVGSVAVLGAFALFEPFNVAVTPLLFLFTGAAAADATATDPIAPRLHGTVGRVGAAASGVVLAAAIALAGLTIAASTFERWGVRYEDQPALRTALDLQPWRVSAGIELVRDRALDARSRNVPGATADARDLIEDLVGRSGWDPRVRPAAADAEVLMNDPDAARAWLRAQLARFPGDVAISPDPDELGDPTPSLPAPDPG